MYTNHYLHIPELPAPLVNSGQVTSTAGEDFTLRCNFNSPANLFRAPVVEWLDSDETIVSNSAMLLFTPLKTLNAGRYTCRVNIFIFVIDIDLTGSNSTLLYVRGKE